MYIEYDEYELIEFFGKEPKYLTEKGAGEFICIVMKNGFELCLLVSIYEYTVSISLSYNDVLLYNQIQENINKIKLYENTLRIYTNDKYVISIRENNFYCITIERGYNNED